MNNDNNLILFYVDIAVTMVFDCTTLTLGSGTDCETFETEMNRI